MAIKIAPISNESMEKVDPSSLKRIHPKTPNSKLEILAGPMLRYWGMHDDVYKGSVTYVLRDANSNYHEFPQLKMFDKPTNIEPIRFANVENISFFRFDFEIKMDLLNSKEVSYQLGEEHEKYTFVVPGVKETMRTMFFSCNGFSLAVDPKLFPGCLWDDVLKKHFEESPIHVMLGGGDQLYCDSINLILPENTMKNRHEVPEEGKMRTLLNRFYLHQYIDWYGRGYWKGKVGETYQSGWVKALATIPSISIFDDHDIIDGFGTYRDKTMRSPIFEMLGEYAYRYYMYFQQNVGVGVKANQGGTGLAAETDLIADPKLNDNSWISTGELGPYIHEPCKSVYAKLGKTAAFLGLDCRTERKLDQVCTPKTYGAVFDRLYKEFNANKEIKHLYVMLGVPIAYPRMVFAENLMSSKLIGPIKFMAKNKIAFSGLVNPFDGDIELLDDLNDHWCAKHHKKERNWFVTKLMELQKDLGVRVTILSGDVHLAAVGIFRSLREVPLESDHRFMVCPVSSAIVNTPPPPGLANFLNHRNKTHILRGTAKERLIPIFNAETTGDARQKNHTCMARRNFCLLDPVLDDDKVIGTEHTAGAAFNAKEKHKSKHDLKIKVNRNSVKMTLFVETDNTKSDAKTSPYEMYIPTLE